MSLLRLIIFIQFLLTFTCLLIQIYGLFSVKWAIFESRVDLGLVEEHGHYGLWSICTYRKLVPAEVDDDGHVILNADCDPMNTFFNPGHSRALIAFFAICHTISLLVYIYLILIRLVELCQKPVSPNSNENDLEMNQNKAKRFMIILTRFIAKRKQSEVREEDVKRQIRIKLYVITIAVVSTLFSLLSAIAPRKTLRETDIFAIENVSENNYRVWRGPGFWAQLTTMIMDMLITSLIVIEVRVLFVLQNLQQTQTVTSSYSTEDNNHEDQLEVIVNPFCHSDSFRPVERIVRQSEELVENNDQQTTHPMTEIQNSMRMTRPKTLMNSNSSTEQTAVKFNRNDYVNSKEVRQMKRKAQKTSNQDSYEGTSYCNPMYCEDGAEEHVNNQ